MFITLEVIIKPPTFETRSDSNQDAEHKTFDVQFHYRFHKILTLQNIFQIHKPFNSQKNTVEYKKEGRKVESNIIKQARTHGSSNYETSIETVIRLCSPLPRTSHRSNIASRSHDSIANARFYYYTQKFKPRTPLHSSLNSEVEIRIHKRISAYYLILLNSWLGDINEMLE